ncbi:MAG: TIM barrel protein [Gemmatimonadales bacterium]|nr:TIM barrel protein [Gemmatimonadales bacterium]NIN10198.1 TIM barrel protein [Gemmatimonadales bacterium]NIN48954.1 TIM barrel protein [Gemmatimonadales bacterium]NIP06418.1 TIM barrel protein [Gemmatimonadales bacterium]NIQ98770.1 TIM barrel protein [Gemmatimonadales bacterium]
MKRREFLETSAAALGALVVSEPFTLRSQLFGISLAEWSLHRMLWAGQLDNLGFLTTARVDYGIDAVEYVNSFFKDKAEDRSYLTELKGRADDNGVTSLLIMCDGEGALGNPDDGARTTAVENHYRWVEAAKYLGCHSIRVNAQSAGSPDEQGRLVADGLRRLTDFSAERDINVIVENHGGLSSNGAWLASVIRAVDHPRCGTLPDFGNFRIQDEEWYDRYRGVAELMPFAKAVSAKSSDFDPDGNERNTDYLRMMRIVLDAGYRGYVGIEYEGDRLSEPDGIRATKALLERVRAQLDEEYQ